MTAGIVDVGAFGVDLGGFYLGADSPYQIDSVEGWRGTPASSFEDVAASDRHGVIATRGRVPARYVTLGGFIWAPSAYEREAHRRRFMQAFPPAPVGDVALRPFRVTQWARTVTAYGQVAAAGTPEDFRGGPQQRWFLQWRQPDPRVFLDPVTVTAALVTRLPGLRMRFAMPGVMPAKPIGGLVVVDHDGNDPGGSPTTITLAGGQADVGVAVLGTGKRVQYGFGLSPSDTLTIDTRRGSLLNGVPRPTWLPGSDPVASLALPPGVSIVQATGTATGGSPTITVTVEPASWI